MQKSKKKKKKLSNQGLAWESEEEKKIVEKVGNEGVRPSDHNNGMDVDIELDMNREMEIEVGNLEKVLLEGELHAPNQVHGIDEELPRNQGHRRIILPEEEEEEEEEEGSDQMFDGQGDYFEDDSEEDSDENENEKSSEDEEIENEDENKGEKRKRKGKEKENARNPDEPIFHSTGKKEGYYFKDSPYSPFENFTKATFATIHAKHRISKKMYHDLIALLNHPSFKIEDLPPNFDSLRNTMRGLPLLPYWETWVFYLLLFPPFSLLKNQEQTKSHQQKISSFHQRLLERKKPKGFILTSQRCFKGCSTTRRNPFSRYLFDQLLQKNTTMDDSSAKLHFSTIYHPTSPKKGKFALGDFVELDNGNFALS